jgi:regulator of replication initiation timing
MTAKEYLSQTYRIDQRINSKLEQVTSLRDLAAKATMTFSDMPHNAVRNSHSRERIIDKILDLESEINADIDDLVDLKREMVQLIKRIENSEYQTLLEQRYLCFKSWEQIAVDMGYELRYLHKLHGRALECCEAIIIRKEDTKRHY